jgi:glycosyltransferase involved in cell wall biosynthesis
LLKFLEPEVVHRAVVLPRPGVIADLLSARGVTDELFFEPSLVENPIEPWGRAITRADFAAPVALRAARLVGNVARGAWSVARLRRRIVQGHYDLIYCNGTTADFAGGALARLTGVPALWHVRYTSVPRALAPVHDRLSASRGVRRIVCVSKAAASLFPAAAAKVRVVHNALDVDEFSETTVRALPPVDLGLSARHVVFGAHGRILRRKGFVEMIQAASAAWRRMTDGERAVCRFVVVGDTPDDMPEDHLARCRVLAHDLGLADVFRFTGFCRDVRPLLSRFDVALVPSVYADPLPRAVMEAMALAKPVVAFDVGGVGEMVVHDETGTLLPDPRGDQGAAVARLTDAMLTYLRNPELRRRHGLAGRARIVRDFDGRARGRILQEEILRATGRSS